MSGAARPSLLGRRPWPAIDVPGHDESMLGNAEATVALPRRAAASAAKKVMEKREGKSDEGR